MIYNPATEPTNVNCQVKQSSRQGEFDLDVKNISLTTIETWVNNKKTDELTQPINDHKYGTYLDIN